MSRIRQLFTLVLLTNVEVFSKLMIVHKVECNFDQSNTCTNGFCSLSAINKQLNLVHFGCDLKRPVARLQVSLLQVCNKMSTNYLINLHTKVPSQLSL